MTLWPTGILTQYDENLTHARGDQGEPASLTRLSHDLNGLACRSLIFSTCEMTVAVRTGTVRTGKYLIGHLSGLIHE